MAFVRARSAAALSLASSIAVAILASPTTGRADTVRPEEHERAVHLFVKGRTLLEAGKCPDAIPVLYESLLVQPSVGARISLAECLEAKGALADAYNQLFAGQELADRGGDPERRDFAHAAAARLEPAVAMIRVLLPAPSEVELLVDGVGLAAVDQALLRSRYALTPGERHRVEARAPGKVSWRWETRGLRAGQPPVTLSVVFAEPAPAPTRSAPDGGGAGAGWGTQKTMALVSGGVGLVGLVVGAVAGGLASSRWSASQAECETPTQCPHHAESVMDHDAASSLATASTIAFVAGGATVAAAAVLFLSAPSQISTGSRTSGVSLRASPSLGPGGGGVTLGGVF